MYKTELQMFLSNVVSSGVVLPSNLDQASITPQSSGIVYSKEYLSELKASTLSTPSPSARQPAASYDSDLTFDASELAGAIIIDDSLPTGKHYCPSECNS